MKIFDPKLSMKQFWISACCMSLQWFSREMISGQGLTSKAKLARKLQTFENFTFDVKVWPWVTSGQPSEPFYAILASKIRKFSNFF